MSSRPPGSSSIPPPLPKPLPPPKPPQQSAPAASEIALAEKLEPVELEITFSPDEASREALPDASDEDSPPPSRAAADEPVAAVAASTEPPPVERPVLPWLPDPVPPKLSPLARAEQAVTLFKSAASPAPSPLPFTPQAEHALTVPIERAEIVMPEPSALSAALAGDIELTTLPRGVLAPPALVASKEAPSTATVPPAADSDAKPRGKGRGVLFAVVGLAGAAAVATVVVQAARGHDRASLPAAQVPTTPVPEAHPSVAVPEPAPAPAGVGPCKLAGEPRVVAPEAVVATGIEARAFGDEIAVGFASSDHRGGLLHVDPTSLATTSASTKSYAPIVRRVTPTLTKKGKISLVVDVDKKGDALHGRRTLDLDPPLQVGAAKQYLVWTPSLKHKAAGKLWPLQGDDGVEAPRGVQLGSEPMGVVIGFRNGGSLWVGQADRSGSSLQAKGDLSRLGRQGEMVGAPAIAASDGVVMMAWAARKTADDPWRMRWLRFKAGESPGPDHAFVVPAGGPGEQSMAPGLAALPGGRFLLVWTEGPASAHEVRAQTLSSEGTALGEPLRISATGVNAGQGQPAVTSTGRGVVAFLAADGSRFEVVAAPIACTL
jgi:hypothetical protein